MIDLRNAARDALITDSLNHDVGLIYANQATGKLRDAAKAIADRNGKELDGRALKVNEAKPREERPVKM